MSANLSKQKLESLTQQLGREMFAATRKAAGGPLTYEWWEERMLQQMMQYEWLKIQAFRFIDALPTLDSDIEVARHMREYFVHPVFGQNGRAQSDSQAAALAELEPRKLQRFVYGAVSRMMNFRKLDSAYAKFFVWLSRYMSGMMAGGFIAGSNIDEAVKAILKLRKQQLPFTIDVLGESAVSTTEAEEYQQKYLHLISELPKRAAQWAEIPLCDLGDGEPLPRVNVSVKITSIYPGFDPLAAEAAKTRAKEILRPMMIKSMEGGAHLHVDMEHYAIKDLTLELFEELLMEPQFRDYPHFGIVLQAYLKDGEKDAQRMIDFAKKRGVSVNIRLVKGAYWDSETVWAAQKGWPVPVWEQKWQSDACYERVTRMLLENHQHIHSAFASHNIRSLCHAAALRRLLNVPQKAFEWQMLFGMGNPMKRAAVQMGERCRVYTPFGEMMPGMAYLIRRLLENTANESFLRNAADESHEAELLENPDATGERTPPPTKTETIRYEFEEPIMDPFVNVPNTDFALEENRQRMMAAIGQVRSELGGKHACVIGGEPIETGTWFDSVNPSRPTEVVGKVAQAGAAEAERAVETAAQVFKNWRRTPAVERAKTLFKAGEILQQRRFEFAALEAFECGKTWREADADVSEAIDYCNFYGKEIRRITENPRRRDVAGEINEYFYVPRGVAAVVSPWNAPLAGPAGMLAAALVTGNTVVFRPAQQAAVLGAKLVKVFEEAGLPVGALNFVPSPDESVIEALVRHPQVSIVAYAGSPEGGKRINELAATATTARPSLRKVVAEMGAKNAIIVDADADLDEAVKGVLAAAFADAGQKPSSCSRVIVAEHIYERMMGRFLDAAKGKRCGPADEPTTAVPPVIDKAAFEKAREYVAIGKQEAECVVETDVAELVEKTGGGYYVAPTVFTNVKPGARIAQEAIPGPMLCIIKVADIDEAIDVFNDCDYALVGGIYSRSPDNIERARSECECGNFYINRVITGEKVDLQPFGGFKMSGADSKTGGPDYLLQFCDGRTVTENTLRRGFAPSEEMKEAMN